MAFLHFPKYQWQALSHPAREIRILNILPNPETHRFMEETACSLTTIRLDKDHVPRYRALSYVWGDPTSTVPITIVEEGVKYTASITESLASALQHLPRNDIFKEEPLPLWIDAICIDQSNDDERSEQVQIMSQVYANARGVLVWLGPGSVEVDRAITYLQNLKLVKRDGEEVDIARMDAGSPTPGFILPYLEEPDIRALKAFFALPWWTRIWVVQEVAFGQEVFLIAGRLGLKWELVRQPFQSRNLAHSFQSFHTKSEGLLRRLAADFIQMDNAKQELQWLTASTATGSPVTFDTGAIDQVLWAFRRRQATLAHDKIYALLELSNTCVLIVPNYKLPADHLYSGLAKSLIIRQPSPTYPLDHIGFTHSSERVRRHTFPSWVPDWAYSPGDTNLLADYGPWSSTFSADDKILESCNFLLTRQSEVIKKQ